MSRRVLTKENLISWMPSIITGLVAIISGVINYHLNKPVQSPQPHLSVKCSIIHTSFLKEASVRGILLQSAKAKSDELDLVIQNDGDLTPEDAEINISSLVGSVFSVPELKFEPLMSRKYCEVGANSTSSLSYTFSKFGKRGIFTIQIPVASRIYQKDVAISVEAFDQWWLPSFDSPSPEELGTIEQPNSTLKVSENKWDMVPMAYADEMPAGNTSDANSSVYLGGYDPLKLMNNTFLLLQSIGIINPSEARIIKQTVEASKGSVILAGVNIPKFHEVLINLMLSKQIITRDEGIAMIENSRKAGGIAINGYNPIYLNAEILGILAQRKFISQLQAQTAMDDASRNANNVK